MGIKRILSIFMATSVLFGFSAVASAAEFKFSGTMVMAAQYTNSPEFTKEGDGINAALRFRPRFDAIINENLSASLQLQIGTYNFGIAGGGVGSRGGNGDVTMRQAYIDWKMPTMTNINIRMGIQPMAMPSATFGSPVLDDNIAGIAINYAINQQFAINLTWSRPYAVPKAYNYGTAPGTDVKHDRAYSGVDLVELDIPMTFGGINVTPWGAFANVSDRAAIALGHGASNGSNSFGEFHGGLTTDTGPTKGGYAWWGGAAITLNNLVPNLSIGIDAMYGATQFGDKAEERSGYMASLEVQYKMPMFTPGLKYWYTSGDRAGAGSSRASGVMPSISSAYAPMYFAFADTAISLGEEGILGGYDVSSTQGVALELADITFIKDLSHLFQLGYVMGTSSKDTVAPTTGLDTTRLTTKDGFLVLNFNTSYAIYENLTSNLAIGYMHAVTTNDNWVIPSKDALAIGVSFAYSF